MRSFALARRVALWAVLAAPLAFAAPAPAFAGDLQLVYSVGTLASRVRDGAGNPLGVGNLAVLYRSSGTPDPATVLVPRPGTGFDFADPSRVVASLTIGQGVQPPGFQPAGRIVGSLDLGNAASPVVPPGESLYVIAFNAATSAQATAWGISSSAFAVPALPGATDVPSFVDFQYAGFQLDDADSDGVTDASDNCPTVSNTDQADGDGDAVGNACDNCPTISNPRFTGNMAASLSLTGGQVDDDCDGIGNACDTAYGAPGGFHTAVSGQDILKFKNALNKPVSGSNCPSDDYDTGSTACELYDLDGKRTGFSGNVDGADLVKFKATINRPIAELQQSCPSCPLPATGACLLGD